MQGISSKEYAELISKTTDEAIKEKELELDRAYRLGILNATKHFMRVYKAARDEFSSKESGLTFEALDYLFNTCAGTLIGDEI